MAGFTRRTLLAFLGLLPFSRRRARAAQPSSYFCEVPAFARYLEFPDGSRHPIGDCLNDPDIIWDGSCFVRTDPATGAKNRLLIVDRWNDGERIHLGGYQSIRLHSTQDDIFVPKAMFVIEFEPDEIEILPDESLAWNIPATFCAEVRGGNRNYLKHIPQGMLVAAILGCKFRFDDGQLRSRRN